MCDGAANPVHIEHRRLRSAIEFAVAEAQRGQRARPPEPFPDLFARYLHVTRIPAGALGPLRRAVEADDAFRRRVAAAVAGDPTSSVDEVGREWLGGSVDWAARAMAVVETDRATSAAQTAAGQLRRAEKRRVAAEHAAERERATAGTLRGRLDEAIRAADEARHAVTAAAQERAVMSVEIAEARTAARHAEDRTRAAGQRLAGLADELAAMRAERDEAVAQRDALLAERAERAGSPVAVADLGVLRDLAVRARRVADQLASVVATPAPPPRRPLALPGGVSRDSERATAVLLRAGAVVLVDGYNVSIGTWPDRPLAEQRRRLLDLCDGVARRFGSDLVVIFDGADVVGAHHAGPRRLVRVSYSSAGVTADDVIRAEIAAVPTSRPVVVVTDDGEVRRDAAAAGANLIGSGAFVAIG
ncbi:MAG: NYN domain-containing protein [Desertimonas sp.]